MFGTVIYPVIDVGVQEIVRQPVGLHLAVEDTGSHTMQRLAHVVTCTDGVPVVEVIVEAYAAGKFTVFGRIALIVALCPQCVGIGDLL